VWFLLWDREECVIGRSHVVRSYREVDLRSFYQLMRVRSRPLFVNVSFMWIGGGMGRLFGLRGMIALTSSWATTFWWMLVACSSGCQCVGQLLGSRTSESSASSATVVWFSCGFGWDQWILFFCHGWEIAFSKINLPELWGLGVAPSHLIPWTYPGSR
jgi:hypothetical protein